MSTEPKGRGTRKTTGDIGREKERLAEQFLIGQGLTLLKRNHRCRLGEIDLVMRDAGTLVFVEVRFRRSLSHGTPAETVGPRKQQRLVKAARHYLQASRSMLPCRFDVVAISGPDQIHWIRHAFVLDAF